jgi:hypothetical protein
MMDCPLGSELRALPSPALAKTLTRRWLLCLTAILALATLSSTQASDPLERGFRQPPLSSRPWVYWFWLNGNITREGVTADLEAMRRVGIGGVLIMEVDQGAPPGPVGFISPRWRELFQHVVREAHRLGLQVNMNNDAGWNGSGGPWITPEQSMQKVVWTEVNVQGPQVVTAKLALPAAVAGYYRDLAVWAFPTAGPFRIDNLKAKAGYEAAYVGPATPTNVPPEMIVDRARLVDLTARMASDGQLNWGAPAGRWTIMRFGHTTTGVENAPSPASGRGLECDKLSREGIEAHFAGMMHKLIQDVGREAGRTLVATHIDSWENGAQNWTARMREEFQQRRGYDLWPFLPVFSGRVVSSLDISERFLWDLRQTISDLVVENYAGHLRTLAQRHGMRLSIEAYGGPCDDLPYAGRADEPMGEFWIGGSAFNTLKGMASAAHTYGRPIVGAEAFTAADQEKWLEHPASIKPLGDRAFCEGINRFVFHRYALQPWIDREPGMTMGPWGLHYERTQTWWEWSRPWHEYLARCQFLLRQGLFLADLAYLNPEAAPHDFPLQNPPGYDYDHVSSEVLLTRMSVRDGRLVLPDGQSYRLLVLPDHPTMTPVVLRKLRQLVEAGATVLGPRPTRSPSLTGYPECDDEVRRLAEELWGSSAPSSPSPATPFPSRQLGRGTVLWGLSPVKALEHLGVRPDFVSRPRLRFLHRVLGDTDLYFVANPKRHEVEALCTFRVGGKQPELWWPDSGRMETAAAWEVKDGSVHLPIRFEPAGSVFVVFRRAANPVDPVVALSRSGQSLLPTAVRVPRITVERALYGVLNDPQRTRDVRLRVQRIADSGEESFPVSDLAQEGDPAPLVVKMVRVLYTVDGQRITVSGRDGDTVHLPDFQPRIVIEKARYGVLDDPKRTRDVQAKLQRLVDGGRTSFSVAEMAAGDDPAFLVVKTLVVDYTLEGQAQTARGTDPEILALAQPPTPEVPRIAQLSRGVKGQVSLATWQPGDYTVAWASGTKRRIEVSPPPAPIELTGPWQVTFKARQGAPDDAPFESLIDWSNHPDVGIQHFSGEATYRKQFEVPPGFLGRDRRVDLDLGRVAVMARVRVNGKDLGTLWKPPFRVDITKVAKRGRNTLEVRVVNLWPNALIGDEQRPEDSERNPDGTLKAWPAWLGEGKPSPTGRRTFTTWRLWKKDSPRQTSGLLGPVRIEAATTIPLDATR